MTLRTPMRGYNRVLAFVSSAVGLRGGGASPHTPRKRWVQSSGSIPLQLGSSRRMNMNLRMAMNGMALDSSSRSESADIQFHRLISAAGL